MKSTMKLIIVALVFAAVLAIPSAVSARGYNVTDLNAGDVAFVYETGLNVTILDTSIAPKAVAPTISESPPTSFRKYANDQPDPSVSGGGSMLAEIPLTACSVAAGTPAGGWGALCLDINTAPPYLGTWFPYNATATNSVYKVNPNNSIQIQHADVTLDAVLNTSHPDSIATKSVTRDTNITFKLTSTYVSSFYQNKSFTVPTVPTTATASAAQGKVNIELVTPGGGKISIFGDGAQANGPGDFRNIVLISLVQYTDTLPGGAQSFRNGAIDLTGVEAGTYTATAKWTSSMPWYNLEANSNSITFTVLSKPITITTNKETVVRGNSFVVTIAGESKAFYWVYIKNTSVSSTKVLPQMAIGQSFVNVSGATGDPNGVETGAAARLNGASALWAFERNVSDAPDTYLAEANVTTAADGTRSIQFDTSTATDDRKYTIKALSAADPTKYDQVDVTVEKGAITITYEGTGTYYLGETVQITGTNTDNTTVYLALKGPNLNDGGVSLTDIFFRTDGQTKGESTGGGSEGVRFKAIDVNTDNTWSYKWDTSKLNASGAVSLDAGTYTIYAVSDPVLSLSGSDLATHIYETASVVLKKPFVTASTSANTIAKGDILYVTGTAEGKPTNVFIWLFGTNYRSLANSASVESDASFSYKLDRGDTSDLYAGQYFAVVQHPMMNGKQDVVADTSGTAGTKASVTATGTWTLGNPSVTLTGLQASDAATALVDLLNSPNIDDTYTKLSFMIEEPWIRIDTIGDKYVGDTFTITGTTNLAEGDTILMTVTSTAFQPTEKTQAGEFSGTSGSVSVQKGDTYNTFSFNVDASAFKPDQYLVKAESVEPSQSTTATFNVLEGPVTTAATTAPATVVTTAAATPVSTTEVATAVPATTAKPQPGFGALVALVGLGAVALLVLRRR
jgi:PGF-CTERM protein